MPSLQIINVEHNLVIDFRFKDHENTEERRWDILGLFWLKRSVGSQVGIADSRGVSLLHPRPPLGLRGPDAGIRVE